MEMSSKRPVPVLRHMDVPKKKVFHAVPVCITDEKTLGWQVNKSFFLAKKLELFIRITTVF